MSWQRPVQEWTEYQAPDGTIYDLTVPSRHGRWVMAETGWGAAPVQHITQRGPLQHGETIIKTVLRPRVVQLVVRQDYCNRNDFWTGRQALVDALRMHHWHELNEVITPGVLRRILPNGTTRALEVYPTQGPVFEASREGSWDQWGFQEILRFIAYDPRVYDPTRVDTTLAIGATTVVNYDGNWDDFPILVISGELGNPTITNDTTGELLALIYTIPDPDVVTIDLTVTPKSVVDQAGVDRISTLTNTSHLATWHLQPGNNSITTTASIIGMDATIQLRHFNRYFGI